MEITLRHNPLGHLWITLDSISGLGAIRYARRRNSRASIPLEVYAKSDLDWDVIVSHETRVVSHKMLTFLRFRNAFFLGAPFNVVIFLIPQRFQVVNGTSPLGAGTRLLPFTCASPIGSMIASIVAKKKVPPLYLVVFGSCLQVVGFSLLSTLPTTAHIAHRQYGYQVIAGFGVGINISTLILMTPFCVQKKDQGLSTSRRGRQELANNLHSRRTGLCQSVPLHGGSYRSCDNYDCSQWLRPLTTLGIPQ